MNLILLKFLMCFTAFEISLHGMEVAPDQHNNSVYEQNNHVNLEKRPADAIIASEVNANRVAKIINPAQVIAEHQRIAASSNLSLNYNPATMTKPLSEYINTLDERYKYIPSDLLVTAVIETTKVETDENRGKQQSPDDVVNIINEISYWYDPKAEKAELYNVAMGLKTLNNLLGPKGEPELRYKGIDGKGVNRAEYFNVLSQVRYTTDKSLANQGVAVYTKNTSLNGHFVYQHVSNKVLSTCIIEFLNTKFEKKPQFIINRMITNLSNEFDYNKPIVTSPADLIKDINNFVLPAAQDSGVLIGDITQLQKIYLTMNAIEAINAKYPQYQAQEGLDLSSFQQPAPKAAPIATVQSVNRVAPVESTPVEYTTGPSNFDAQSAANNTSNAQLESDLPVNKIPTVNLLMNDPLVKQLVLPLASESAEFVGSDAHLMQNMGIDPTQFDKQVSSGVFSFFQGSLAVQDIAPQPQQKQIAYKGAMIKAYKMQNIENGKVNTFQAFIALSKDIEALNNKIEALNLNPNKNDSNISALQAIVKVATSAQVQLNTEYISGVVAKLVTTDLPMECAVELVKQHKASIEKKVNGSSITPDNAYIQGLINKQYSDIYAKTSELLGGVNDKISDNNLDAMQEELKSATGDDKIVLTEAIKQFEMNNARENEAVVVANSLFAAPSDPIVTCLNTLLNMDSLKNNKIITLRLSELLATYETSVKRSPEQSIAPVKRELDNSSTEKPSPEQSIALVKIGLDNLIKKNLTQVALYSPLKLYTDVVTQLQPKITAVPRYTDFLVKNKASFTTNIDAMKTQIENLQKNPSPEALQKAIDEFNKNIEPTKINNIQTADEIIALYNKIIQELQTRYETNPQYKAGKNWVDGWNNFWKGDILAGMENVWSSVSLGSKAVETSLENLVKEKLGPLWDKIPKEVQYFILTSLVAAAGQYILLIQNNSNLTSDQKKKMQEEAVQSMMYDVGSVVAATSIGADVDILKSGDTQAIGMSVLLNQMTNKLTPNNQANYQTVAMNSGAYTTNMNNFQAKYAAILQQQQPMQQSNMSGYGAGVRSPYSSSSSYPSRSSYSSPSTSSYSSPSAYSSYTQPSYSSTYTKSPYAPSSYGSSTPSYSSSSSLGSSTYPSFEELMAMPG